MAQVTDDMMTEENQRRASPDVEAAANAAIHSPPSDRALSEFAVHPGLIGVLARECIRLRAKLAGVEAVLLTEAEDCWPTDQQIGWDKCCERVADALSAADSKVFT